MNAATTEKIVGVCVVVASVFIIGYAPNPAPAPKPLTEKPAFVVADAPAATANQDQEAAQPVVKIADDGDKPKASSTVYLICLVYCIFSGIVCSLQAGFNTALAIGYKSSSFASLLAASTGIPICAIVFAFEQNKLKINLKEAIKKSEWWCWTGGFVSFGFILTLTYLPDRIGASTVIGTLVCTQVVSSLVVDHFGLIGLSVKKVGWIKCFGAVLLIAGVVVMSVYGS
ncbi:hypothetical protein HDU98_004932 [Podochytrium sp. JEL0797]|nr:hypothetical protein HDU98_004932 [Podochytrium sp. JEL0797]